VVFIQAQADDAVQDRVPTVLRQSVKHIKWLANKRGFKNIVLHSFTHLGGEIAPPDFANKVINAIADRLGAAGYQVWSTPFGYFCEWDLSVHGESLAKVWKEIG
jgi:Archaea-specific editing domain of threonyl-tRNA synthetase